MNTKRPLLVLAMLIASIATCFAQPKIGVRAGYNLSNILEFMEFSSDDGSAWKPGFNVGVVADFQLSEKIMFRPGLYYSTKGFKDDKLDCKSGYNFLEAPLLAAFQQPLGESLKLEFQVGPYLGIGIGGKTQLYGLPELKTFGDLESKRFDWGLNIGCGLHISQIYVGASFEDGFVSHGNQYKHHCLMLNAGYSF